MRYRYCTIFRTYEYIAYDVLLSEFRLFTIRINVFAVIIIIIFVSLDLQIMNLSKIRRTRW